MFESQRTFSHRLYNQNAIQETIEAYAELLSVEIEANSDNTEATFKTSAEDGPMFVDAFCNHALFLSIQAHRQGDEA